jgi:hypothetical protein
VKWQNSNGGGAMPNYGKQQTVIDYITQFEPGVFIETGTYKGKMVYAVMPYISQICSIELDKAHAERAQRRFAGYDNIQIIQGQSGEVLPELLEGIHTGCLFWLDAHYSGGSTAKGASDTPIMQELETILKHECSSEHVLLIDDAGCFGTADGYPTVEQVRERILNVHEDWTFEMKNDIMRAHRKI